MTIPAPDPQTFHWIKDALDGSLNAVMSQVRLAEQESDYDQLTTVPGNLHQINGSLRMVELDAAGTLAEDLEALSQQLCGNHDDTGEATESLEALVQGLESLQGYVDAISRQTPLSPLDLAERINQIRRLTGRDLISQLDLFEPPLDLLDLDSPAAHSSARQSGNGSRRVVPDEMRVKLVTQLRRKYRRALLSWLASKDGARKNKVYLDRIEDLLSHLFHISSLDISRQLLWVAGGFVEAIASGDLNADNRIKTQFARLDIEISRLEDDNISNIAVDPPDQLLRQMLFYIGGIDGAESERVREIQNALHLTEWFDGDDSRYRALVQASQQLHALGKEFGAENFSGLEEALNTYFAGFGNSGPDSTADVDPGSVLESLDKLSAGIVNSGLTTLTGVADGLSRAIQTTAQNPEALSSTQADIKIASALLFIRDSISSPDDIDVTWQQSVDSHEQELNDLAGTSADDSERDLRVRRVAEIEHQHARSAVAAVVRETLGSLEKLLATDNAEDEIPADQLAAASQNMVNMANVLAMVQSDQAAQVATRLSEWMSAFASSRVSPGEDNLEHMAFAVAALGVSADYLANKGPKDDKVLETARERLNVLDIPQAVAVTSDGEPEEEAVQEIPEEPPFEATEEAVEEPRDNLDSGPATVGETDEEDPEPLAEIAEVDDRVSSAQSLLEELDRRRRQLKNGTIDGVRELMESFESLSGSDAVDRPVKKLAGIGRSVCTGALDNDSVMTPEKRDFIGLLVRQIKDSVQSDNTADIDVDAWQSKFQDLSATRAVDPGESLADVAEEYATEQPSAVDSGADMDGSDESDDDQAPALESDSEFSIPGLAQLDLDLRTIFIEELGSHLKKLKHCLNSYRSTEPGTVEATGALNEIDDCVHTLSGNCRNLGFDEAADCAEAAVAVLGRDRTIDRNARLAHFAESLLLLGQARVQVRENGKYDAELRERLGQYLERSKVFQEDHEETAGQDGADPVEDETVAFDREPDSESLSGLAPDEEISAEPASMAMDTDIPQETPIVEEPSEETSANSEITDADQDQPTLETDPGDDNWPADTSTAEQDDGDIDEEIDEEIRQIFVEESESILGRINGHLLEWRDGADQASVLAGIRREFHTLKGSAAATGFSDVSALSHRIESLLESRPLEGGAGDSGGNGKIIDLLEEIHDGLAVDLGIMESDAKGHIPGLDKKIDQFLGMETGDASEQDDVAVTTPDATLEEDVASGESGAESENEMARDNSADSPEATVDGEFDDSVPDQIAGQPEDNESVIAPDAAVEDEGLAGKSVDLAVDHPESAAPVESGTGKEEILAPAENSGAEVSAEQQVGNPDPGSVNSGGTEGKQPTEPEPGSLSGPDTSVTSLHDDGDVAIARARSWMPALGEQTNPGQAAEEVGSTGMLRIDNTRLAELINASGELSLVRSQLQDTLDATRMDLDVLHTSMSSMRAGLRDLELEADAQVRSLPEQQTVNVEDEFDPLQLDRYSRLQAKSREVTVLLDQLAKVERDLGNRTSNLDGALRQQLHLGDQLQSGLMSARMVTMAEYLPRLRFLVRETSRQSGKPIDLDFHGGDIHLDRQVAETMMAPFEHMIRNSVAHGIEAPEIRKQSDKPETGKISLSLVQQGAELVVTFEDDGNGLDTDKLKSRAVELGLADSVGAVSEVELLQVITQPGYSTADALTMESGRGVGMDVVYQAVRDLGGSMTLDNRPGEGITFQFRLPVTLALAQALLVRVSGWRFAVHSRTIERLMRVAESDVFELDGKRTLEVDGQNVTLFSVRERLGEPGTTGSRQFLPVMLVRLADRFAAFEVDEFEDSVNIVSKSSGRQLASIPEISGVTVLGDSSIVLILDPEAFVEHIAPLKVEEKVAPAKPIDAELQRVLIVDDSLVVRKVMQKDLEADGLDVETAVDGVNALEVLERTSVDLALVDIEMPRMNGYELLEKLRSDERLGNLPVIIITSRSGEQHRQRAMSLGADGYITKPYDIGALDELMRKVLASRRTLH